jgi:hypothetical protein
MVKGPLQNTCLKGGVGNLTQNVTMEGGGGVKHSNTRQIFSTYLITMLALKHTQRGGGVLKNVTD